MCFPHRDTMKNFPEDGTLLPTESLYFVNLSGRTAMHPEEK